MVIMMIVLMHLLHVMYLTEYFSIIKLDMEFVGYLGCQILP